MQSHCPSLRKGRLTSEAAHLYSSVFKHSSIDDYYLKLLMLHTNACLHAARDRMVHSRSAAEGMQQTVRYQAPRRLNRAQSGSIGLGTQMISSDHRHAVASQENEAGKSHKHTPTFAIPASGGHDAIWAQQCQCGSTGFGAPPTDDSDGEVDKLAGESDRESDRELDVHSVVRRSCLLAMVSLLLCYGTQSLDSLHQIRHRDDRPSILCLEHAGMR